VNNDPISSFGRGRVNSKYIIKLKERLTYGD
jgi:hypothetical protein